MFFVFVQFSLKLGISAYGCFVIYISPDFMKDLKTPVMKALGLVCVDLV